MMKIAIIGPGEMPIPPSGWGAVEILIWDYYQILKKEGFDVHIINDKNPSNIINSVNSLDPDFIHIQYDNWFFLEDSFRCKNIALTSHFAYLEQPNKHAGYTEIFNGFCNSRSWIFALSEDIKKSYIQGGKDPNLISVIPNGVRTDLFKFSEECEDKSIYLAKIDYRKRQHLFHDIPNLFFAGNIEDSRYNMNNYLGELSKEYLYQNLTRFSNLILLSDGEAHPLVCLEALSSGLGLVISEFSTGNLDISKPFIDVIPESKINDTAYIESIIRENRLKSRKYRTEIREYSKEFDWGKVIKYDYVPLIKKIANK